MTKAITRVKLTYCVLHMSQVNCNMRFGDRSFSAAGPHVRNGYHLCSELWTWHLTVSDEDLRPICLHWCDEISAPNDYW